MITFDIYDINVFKNIINLFDNLKLYTIESITEFIISLHNDQKFSFKFDPIILFIFLFHKSNIMNNNLMTILSDNIINKIKYNSSDHNFIADINILFNNFYDELNNFIVNFDNQFYDKLIHSLFNLYKLKKSINNNHNLTLYFDNISHNLINSLNKLDNTNLLQKKINQLIITNDIINNLSNITELIKLPLFSDIYNIIECNPEISINEILDQYYSLCCKHIKKKYISKIVIKFNELNNNNDILLNILYKVSSSYENILSKYFIINYNNNFIYKYILELLYNPNIFPEFKLSDDKIVIFSFSIIYFIHHYLFCDFI